jgi:hypothetical protein
VCAIFVATQVEAFLGAGSGRGMSSTRRAVLGVLTFVALALPPHIIRVYANAHPIGRWELSVKEEDANLKAGAVPSLRGYWAPRRYGEQALAAIPRGAVVFGDWDELPNLIYFNAAEGRRHDLALRPITYETLHARMLVWQREHRVGERPFVFLNPPPDFARRDGQLDSLTLRCGWRLWVRRTPIPETPA